ncbi:unnamed protein product [Allacma fusca]|uniref:CRAL-TRIO domain-containing protein n=1 Tax=Allacma fusca TaxID=39272 RepID=A0A8J2LLM0_9HEXA|nr:unnamed protein product [Allacma fusca]
MQLRRFYFIFPLLLVTVSSFPTETVSSNKVSSEKDDVKKKEHEKFSIESWESPEDIAKNFPYYLSGYDSEDRAIVVLELGKWDVRSQAKKGGQGWIDLQRHAEKMIYNLKNSADKKNYTDVVGNVTASGPDDIVLIVDWDGFQLVQLFSPEAIAFVLKYMGKMERFQEKIAYGLFINVNPVANAAVTSMRPILGRFMERVDVYGTQTAQWIPVVRRRLPADQLPAKYGGSKDHKPLIYRG